MYHQFSQITTTLKPNGKIRGISAGDSFRRLTTKSIARQKQAIFRKLVAPANFRICEHSGTDTLAHILQALTDDDPDRVILSIDGVGAFDHVSRARIFQELEATPELHDIILFIRQWYGTVSKFLWTDAEGKRHRIEQGNRPKL